MNAERAGHSLSATALVHEAYLRLGNDNLMRSSGRGAFLHAAAEAMRRILIEHARARGRIKRGGGIARIPLEVIGDVADLDSIDRDGGESIFAFDEAFRRLEEHEPRVADVVRLRFFAGLSVPETALALGISDRTVNNYWAYSRAWLAREMQRKNDQSTDRKPE
jgi:RNA polymerase sigma factor (TIGR02999 family)